MRITIDIDDQHAAAVLVAPANGQATDAGGPPAALLQTLATIAPAAAQTKAGNDAGPPPRHLIQALLNTAMPRANGANASDGGAARG